MKNAIVCAKLTNILETENFDKIHNILRENSDLHHFSIYEQFSYSNMIKAIVYCQYDNLYVIINVSSYNIFNADKTVVKYDHKLEQINLDSKFMLDAIWKNLFNFIYKHAFNKKIIVTGYSFGASLATICASRISQLLVNNDISLYTFGSPKVGNKEWAKNFKVKTYRFCIYNDYVTNLPNRTYYHVGKIKYFDINYNLVHYSMLQYYKDKIKGLLVDNKCTMKTYLDTVEKNIELLYSNR